VQDTLKGTTSEDLKITFRGGKVTLSNGFTAVLHTPVSDGVRAGNQYIFSLKRDGNVLYPVALSQSILKVNESNDIVESLANLEKDRPIVAEVSGVSVGVIENKIYVASRASN
jgi:hypothetical protein